MTRLQFFVVLALVALLFFHVLGLDLLRELVATLRAPAPPIPSVPALVNGIETSWRSAAGGERVWTIDTTGGPFDPWLAAHVAACQAAQKQLPPLEKR